MLGLWALERSASGYGRGGHISARGYLSSHELSKARGEGQSGDEQSHQCREEQPSTDRFDSIRQKSHTSHGPITGQVPLYTSGLRSEQGLYIKPQRLRVSPFIVFYAAASRAMVD